MKAGADDYVIMNISAGWDRLRSTRLAEERRQNLLWKRKRARSSISRTHHQHGSYGDLYYDLVQNRISTSTGTSELIGYSPEEIIAMGSNAHYYAPEDLTKLADNIARFDHVVDGMC